MTEGRSMGKGKKGRGRERERENEGGDRWKGEEGLELRVTTAIVRHWLCDSCN